MWMQLTHVIGSQLCLMTKNPNLTEVDGHHCYFVTSWPCVLESKLTVMMRIPQLLGYVCFFNNKIIWLRSWMQRTTFNELPRFRASHFNYNLCFLSCTRVKIFFNYRYLSKIESHHRLWVYTDTPYKRHEISRGYFCGCKVIETFIRFWNESSLYAIITYVHAGSISPIILSLLAISCCTVYSSVTSQAKSLINNESVF